MVIYSNNNADQKKSIQPKFSVIRQCRKRSSEKLVKGKPTEDQHCNDMRVQRSQV